MNRETVYPYKFRPGYGSENLLFEFWQGVEEADFIPALMDAFSSIHPKIIEIQDVWINDQTWIHFESDAGKFTLAKDIWHMAFIDAPDNQEGLRTLDALLVSNERFLKEDVDFEEYRRPKSSG